MQFDVKIQRLDLDVGVTEGCERRTELVLGCPRRGKEGWKGKVRRDSLKSAEPADRLPDGEAGLATCLQDAVRF